MNATRKRDKRPYLSRDQRHGVLLKVAAGLVEARGWNALTMVSLAQRADVSRQLVYQHFDSVDALLLETLERIFADTYVRTRDTVARGDGDRIGATVRTMQSITMELPPGRRRALWQVISAAGTGIADSGLANLSTRLRHLLVAAVHPLVARQFHVPPEQAKTLAWMLIVAFWGAMQRVNDGELAPEDAMSNFDWLIEHLAQGVQAASKGDVLAADAERQAG